MAHRTRPSFPGEVTDSALTCFDMEFGVSGILPCSAVSTCVSILPLKRSIPIGVAEVDYCGENSCVAPSGAITDSPPRILHAALIAIDRTRQWGAATHRTELLIGQFGSWFLGSSYESQWHGTVPALEELLREKRDKALAHERAHCCGVGFACRKSQPVCTFSQFSI